MTFGDVLQSNIIILFSFRELAAVFLKKRCKLLSFFYIIIITIVTWELHKSNVFLLIYGSECFPLLKNDSKSFDLAVARFLIKLFRFSNSYCSCYTEML